MPSPFCPPFAAIDDLGTIISVIFLAVAFISWIMNLLSGKNQPQPPARRPPQAPVRPQRPRPPERTSSEIEIFFDEATQRKAVRADADPQPARPKPRPRPQPRAAQAARAPKPQATDAGRQAMERLQDSVREQVLHQMRQESGERPSSQLARRVEESVTSQLGKLATQVTPPATGHAPSVTTPRGLVEFLYNPAGMRQAILVNEILKPPKALRRP